MVLLAVIISLYATGTKIKAEAPDIPPTAVEYIKEFAEKYNTDPNVLIKVAKCESRFNQEAIGDGNRSLGIYQYHKGTWERFEDLIGEDLDINSMYDQIKLTSFIFANYPKLRYSWSTFTALSNGGTYKFYSKLLKKNFVVVCKL